MIPFLPEWEWGWKTPLLLEPLSFATASDPALLEHSASLLSTLLPANYLDTFPFQEANSYLSKRLDSLRTSRVGMRFERIQETFFHFHPRTLELRTGLQTSRTEVDLLQRIEPDLLIHWEIAVKFYLALDLAGSLDADRYIGPTLKDCLGLKMRAIRERQLRALAEWPDRHGIGLAETDRTLAFPKVHGILFLPYREDQSLSPPSLNPAHVNPSGLRGTWLPSALLPSFFESLSRTNRKFCELLDRNHWIQDLRLATEIPKKDPTEAEAFRIQHEIEKSQEPRQFSLHDSAMKTESRFFVVPNGWLPRAEAKLDSLRSQSRIKA